MTELDLWLDSYDDIYSDFDSRHYLKRRISEDFLFELHKEMKYKEHTAKDLIIFLPQDRRNEESEKVIASSLGDFFKGQFLIHQDKCRSKMKNGIVILLSGICIMLINSWLYYRFSPSQTINSVKILLEPAGWFLVWAALDFLFFDLKGLRKERNFYRKLNDIHIYFKSA
jgi:hypothetical protein